MGALCRCHPMSGCVRIVFLVSRYCCMDSVSGLILKIMFCVCVSVGEGCFVFEFN